MDFKEHLKKYLSSEFIDDLIASFSLNEHKGLFINTRKISDDEFIKKINFKTQDYITNVDLRQFVSPYKNFYYYHGS